jgi:hypothetical protein
MQQENTTNILRQTRWILDQCKVEEELDKFDKRVADSKGNFKLIVDFNQLEAEFKGKQIDIGSIKYKKKEKPKTKEVINFRKKKSKNSNDLF